MGAWSEPLGGVLQAGQPGLRNSVGLVGFFKRKREKMKRLNDQRGFTLIELVMVIVILGILLLAKQQGKKISELAASLEQDAPTITPSRYQAALQSLEAGYATARERFVSLAR